MSRSISVVIPTHNYGRFIAAAILSALEQTEQPLEIIVVDDGSTDETAAVVGEFGERVKYIWQGNAGVSAARNRGVAESVGEFIAFLDADDVWEPTKLEKQLAICESDPEVGLVHCGMREFDGESGETIAVHLDGQAGWLAQELLLWERPTIIGHGTSIIITRTAFLRAGGFDTRLKCGEDWDFCYRVARMFKVGFVPEPLVNYRSHSAAAHRNVENMECGMAMFYEKAFDTNDPKILRFRRRALGNYHKVMSGSYFQAGRPKKFLVHAVQSIVYRPANIGYFLAFPLRRLR